MTAEPEWIELTQEFDASIEQVWRMWTEPALFAAWYGPNGARVPTAEMAVQVGGVRKICMEMGPADRPMTMWFAGVYVAVEAPTRLVYTESLCDADGTLIPPSAMGMPEGTPEVTQVTVLLREEGGKTVMTLTHRGVPAGTAGEGGWRQAIAKLGESLAGAP